MNGFLNFQVVSTHKQKRSSLGIFVESLLVDSCSSVACASVQQESMDLVPFHELIFIIPFKTKGRVICQKIAQITTREPFFDCSPKPKQVPNRIYFGKMEAG